MLRQPGELARLIDYTLLRPEATETDIRRLCEEALEYSFITVCVAPCYVELAAGLLKGTGVKVGTVVGFPLGNNSVSVKIVESMEAIKHGAEELDMVINLGALKSGKHEYVKNEVANIANVCRGVLLKVILETGALSRDETVNGARLVLQTGTKWVKTCTGFTFRGATLEDVKLLKRTVGEQGFVKASGGIRDFRTAMAMVKAGASRIGTSHGVAIMKEFLSLRDKSPQ